MALLATETRYVHCYDWKARAPYDPGIYTALGVFVGLKSALRFATGSDRLAGLRVLVQGVGDTGAPLARSLASEGAEVLVNDLDRIARPAWPRSWAAQVVPSDAIFDADLRRDGALRGRRHPQRGDDPAAPLQGDRRRSPTISCGCPKTPTGCTRAAFSTRPTTS